MTNLNKETMKRPSEYMTMTDGVTQHDYKQALNKYIDYLEAQAKQLILSGVVASLPDEEMIYVSHGSDGDDDVYCAFTDLSKAEKDCEESGTSLSTISLYRK